MSKKELLTFCLALLQLTLLSQTLNLPARPKNAKNGTQFVMALRDLDLEQREAVLFSELLSGNVPDFIRNLVPVVDSLQIDSAWVNILFYATPDYLAVGHDTNYFYCPMTPNLAQRIADSLLCILPTRKMVNSIWSNAAVKLEPQPIPPSPQMTTVPVFAQHNEMVASQRRTFLEHWPLGHLVAGNKKDIVISNLIHTSPPPERVVIYGWHYPTGKNIQPLYAGHNNLWADYSHGVRLVQNILLVNCVKTLASEILTSPELHTLLSDEGIISQPRYPAGEGYR